MALSWRIFRSNSSAFAVSSCRSINRFPSEWDIRAISSSEKPEARPSAISASRSRTLGANSRRKPRLPIELMSPFSS